MYRQGDTTTEELVDTGDRLLSAFAMRTSRKGFLQGCGRIFFCGLWELVSFRSYPWTEL
jgi:hypothetical protein